MSNQLRKLLISIIIILFVCQGFLQAWLDPLWTKNYAPRKEGLVVAGLSPEQFLVALGGLREFVAGILWVRADGFFHTGNYDAILPMVRIVTWLNPHQVDVYSTGAWHMAYNFVDQQQRSDRRYIMPSLLLLNEGVSNNPTTFELLWESGWMYQNKIDDHHLVAAEWFLLANQQPDMIDARRSSLPHAYEKAGEVDKAVEEWYKYADYAANLAIKNPSDWSNFSIRDSSENNLDLTLLRQVARKYDSQPPLDMDFGVRVTVPERGKLKIVGKMNLGTIGARIRFILKDEGFVLADKGPLPSDKDTAQFSFDVPKDVTFCQDLLYVRKVKFKRDADLSKDPSMYPFKKDRYDLVFIWNPRQAGPHIQDRVGFNGEGITDKRFLTDGYTTLPNYDNMPNSPKWNIIYCKLSITKDQILRRGQWAAPENVPVIETQGFVEPADPE